MRTAPQNAKREAKKGFEIIIKPEHNASPEKLSEDMTYFLKYFALVVQGCNCYTESDIVLLLSYFGVFGGGTRLAMPKTIYIPNISSSKDWFRGY